MDVILEEVYAQKQARENIQDLISDLSLIGRDVFKNTVIELDKAGCQFNPEALSGLGLRLLQNAGNINMLLQTLESINDFLKDAMPIMHQIGLDAIEKMNELERKGYIDFIRALGDILENIVSNFSPRDIRDLADNVVTILETVKRITQPDMLQAVNNAIIVYKSLDASNVPEFTLLKALKEMRSPEMRRGLGFIITFMKNLTSLEQNHTTEKTN
jgi:uncharacterized protein YjgD (DUF1641 family)